MIAVRTGLDRWIDEGGELCGLADGASIGLVAHPASIDRTARHVVEWLDRSGRYRLRRLFAPEHGLWGHEQDMEEVGRGEEPLTGLPIISLYGTAASSLRPDRADLDDLDAIVVDLQDVGTRFYTFVYTLSYVMEAAGEAGLPVVVLDRPNPIGGERIEGPMLQPALSSFVGRYPLPVRHGLTIGELARLFRERYGVGCDLRVVPLTGWTRSMYHERTGLPWAPPSPNMPTIGTALVYPGGCLIEGTNLSEGRGTTLPFELVGAPWVDARELTERLNARALPGVLFRSASFRPMFQKHAGQGCFGVQVIPIDRDRFRPFSCYLHLLTELRRSAPQQFAWRTETYEFESERPAIDYLLGQDGLRQRIENGDPVEELERGWTEGLAEFDELRRSVLLYD